MSTQEPAFQSLRRENLSEQISRQLLVAIAQGYYVAGDRLPPERELAERFQASRVAVREAIKLLSAKGIMTAVQGRGTTINPREQWNVLDPELFMLQSGEIAFEQLNEMRRIFEPEMAALAAERATVESIEIMRAYIEHPLEDEVEQHVDYDTGFHLEIAKATQNTVLLIVMSSITALLRESRRRTFLVPNEIEHSRACHREIFEAIERHDPHEARLAMAHHMEQVQRAIARYVAGDRGTRVLTR